MIEINFRRAHNALYLYLRGLGPPMTGRSIILCHGFCIFNSFREEDAVIVKCSECKKIIREKEPLGDKSITNTLCDKCHEPFKKELKELKKSNWLMRQFKKPTWWTHI